MYRKPFYPNPRQRHWKQPLPTASPSPSPPLGDLIETITRDSLSSKGFVTLKDANISDVLTIASYNWVDDTDPKIFIPGKPPKWTPLAKPRQLQPDDGEYYRDINAASYPNHPLEPPIVSVMRMCPKPTPIDIVACGSTIRSLHRFVKGRDYQPFRMVVEVVGNTVHLIRRNNSPKELIHDVKGYGHKFPEAYTTWDRDVARSKSHQRVLKYRFADLEMMVRFEGDGYIEPNDFELSEKSGKQTSHDNESALDQLSKLQVKGSVPGTELSKAELQILEGGQIIPQKAIFDLKTRSVYFRKNNNHREILDKELPRLWISQIENFILGFHEHGLFKDIEVKNVKDDIKKWEKANQPSLIRLATLLHLIFNRVQDSEEGRIEIVSLSADSVEIRKPLTGAVVAFSDSVKADWSEWLSAARTKHSKTDSRVQSQPIVEVNKGGLLNNASFSHDSDGDELDYTACDEECGYCGKCEY